MLQPVIRTLSSKGQFVVPAKMRTLLSLKPETKILVSFKPEDKKIILEPLEENPIEAGFGLLADWEKSAAEIMTEARDEERQYEEKKRQKLGLG